MHRRFSTMVKNSGKASGSADAYDDKDDESKASTVVREDLAPPSLKVKRVDHYYSKWYKGWKYRNTSAKVTVEAMPMLRGGENDIWKDYSFVIVRKIPRQENFEPTFKIVVKSEYILQACKDVIQSWPGISWNSDPLELEPEMFLTFLEEFVTYRDNLVSKKSKSDLDIHVLASVNLLLSSIQSDYQNTISTIKRLKSHNEITYDLLYSVLVPRSTIVTRCAITGLPRLFQLMSLSRVTVDGVPCYQLNCESIDLVDRPMTQTVGVDRVSTNILIKTFKGTVKIDSLDAYPIQYHAERDQLQETIRERGKKWVELIGVHHKQFNGVAALKCGDRLLRHNVKGRIMIDRAMFRRFNPNYKYPVPSVTTNAILQQQQLDYANDPYGVPPPMPPQFSPAMPSVGGQYANGTLVHSQENDNENTLANADITEEDLLLTSTVVYGFSLSDKLWLEFDVTQLAEVEWNHDAFANLVLPSDRKSLLQSLVEAHHQELGFDDFIKGKGHGLVINLFGPPGVGKTFSAEATSEHVKRPLYLIGAGDLGTDATKLDLALERVFEVATAWKAIVLIDEADVFLEQRSLHDLERNAMVAVFLRHVEYYRGIMFLTTNRVKVFDEAFLSRIHVALHFHELPVESKYQVWKAFIAKVNATADITEAQLRMLSQRDVNGRQIKNAARTAQSLALGRGEKLRYDHFVDTLDAMDDFTKEFGEMRAGK